MKIDLGCGASKHEGYFGIDFMDLPGVDLICDCNGFIPLDDNVADEILANDFLEHVRNDKRIHIMNEIWRILKPGGLFISSTPSTDGRGAFQDPTHTAFWNENSFYYFCNDVCRIRAGIKAKFDFVALSTTPLDQHHVCHVNCTLRAMK